MNRKEKGLTAIKNYTPLWRRLGATVQYKGYLYLVTALDLLRDDPNLIFSLTKGLYPSIGAQFHVSGSEVERCLRTLIRRMWAVNQPLVQTVIGYPIQAIPSNGEFLANLIMLPDDIPCLRPDGQVYMDEWLTIRHRDGC